MNEFSKRKRALSSLFFGAGFLVLGALFSQVGAAEKESKPWQAKPGRTSGWGKKVNYINRVANNLKPEICFIGDSLTEFWSSEGSPIWQLEFHNTKAANLGVAADRVENILWRLKNGALEKIRPEVFVLMLGTNNLSKNPPDQSDDVVRGVAAVLKQIKTKVPSARVLLVSILPNGNDPNSVLRQQVLEVNEGLQNLVSSNRIEFIDAHDVFLNSSKTWKPGLTLDGTHLTMRGYDLLMGQIRGSLQKAKLLLPHLKRTP